VGLLWDIELLSIEKSSFSSFFSPKHSFWAFESKKVIRKKEERKKLLLYSNNFLSFLAQSQIDSESSFFCH
jgi:hypothetical protein